MISSVFLLLLLGAGFVAAGAPADFGLCFPAASASFMGSTFVGGPGVRGPRTLSVGCDLACMSLGPEGGDSGPPRCVCLGGRPGLLLEDTESL